MGSTSEPLSLACTQFCKKNWLTMTCIWPWELFCFVLLTWTASMRCSSQRMPMNVRENREWGNSDPAVGAQTRSRPHIRMNWPSPPRAVQASFRLASASRPPTAILLAVISLGRLTTVPIVTRQVVSRPFKTHDHGFSGSVRRCGHACEQGK